MPPERLRVLVLLGFFACGGAVHAARKEAWVEVKSPHFVAYTDAGEAEARTALKGFEGIRSVFQQAFPGLRVDPPKPTLVLVVENEASMKRFLPQSFEGKDPKRPAGYFISTADRNYAILRLDIDRQADQPYSVVFHEYTHSIIHMNFPALPVWLDEGIADYYGSTEIRSERVFLGRVPVGRLSRLRSGTLLPLETLLTVTHDSPHYQEGEKTGLFYAQSWAFVHYLFMDEQARKTQLLQAYLRVLPSAGDALTAARLSFGDLAKVQTTLWQYARKPAFSFWDLALTVKLTDRDFQSRPLAEAESLVVRAEFLLHTRQEKEAQPLLEQARALAPELPEVHAALGYEQILRGDKAKAGASFAESLRLGSRDFRAPYYLATLGQEGFGQGPSADKILGWLEAARALRPDFPGVHLALCRQYSVEPRDPVRALEEGRQAVELEPQALSYRVNLGFACMNLDLEREAKAIGEQVERLATTADERRMAEVYARSLAQFLERNKARRETSPLPGPEAPGQGGPQSPNRTRPLKFSLPTYLAPLGAEVMQRMAEGRQDEAIRLVEQALSKARQAYDRKVLKALLDDLKAGASPH